MSTLERLLPLLLGAVALFAVYQKFSALGAAAAEPQWVSSSTAGAAGEAATTTAAAAAVSPNAMPCVQADATSSEEMTWFEFFTQPPPLFLLSLWTGSVVFRALFIVTLVLNARRLFDATKLARGPSLTHWAGAVIAHRGYRSEAQQLGQLVAGPVRGDYTPQSKGSSRQPSRRSSRAPSDGGAPTPPVGHSRRTSRDEPLVNPIVAAAAASLCAATIGASTPVSSDGVPLPFARRRSSMSGLGTPLATGSSLGFRRASPPLSTATGNSPLAWSRPLAPSPPVLPLVDPSNYNIPENSMLAFIYAHEQGVHGVEVDVALTKDGHILVMHDNTLDRTMDATGEVPEMTLDQIRACRYRQVTTQEYVIRDPRNRNIDIVHAPTLEYVIEFCRERHLKLMIESKEYTNPKLLRDKLHALYEKYDMYSWSYVASFNPLHIFYIRRAYPLIPTCLLYCRTCTEWYHVDQSQEMLLPRWANFESTRRVFDWLLWYFSPTLLADWLGVSMVGPHNILISPALITSLTTRGIVCDVWVCNAELEKQWLQSLGCIVTTDRLFSHDDVSPFPDSVAAETAARTAAMSAAGEVPLAPSPSLAPTARKPSIHDALEHVAASYYIDHPTAHGASPTTAAASAAMAAMAGTNVPAATTIAVPETVAELEPNNGINHTQSHPGAPPDSMPPIIASSDEEHSSGEEKTSPEAAAQVQLDDAASSSYSSSSRVAPPYVDTGSADASPRVGTGSVDLQRLHLHTRQASEGEGNGMPLVSPTSLAAAEDRLPSD
jgi:glycerophosphoryl diester phosphodiesterase